MFYKLIETKRNEWLDSKECSVRELIHQQDTAHTKNTTGYQGFL